MSTTLELETETPAETIARLEAVIKAASQRRADGFVDTVDGPKTVSQLSKETQELVDSWALTREESKRQRLESEARNPTPYITPDSQIAWQPANVRETPLYPTPEAAQNFVGRERWQAFTPEEKAKLRTITARDVSSHDPLKYFAKDTSRAASALMKENAPMYYVLRDRARKSGII